MADVADPEISVPVEETPSQRQARIRRQKRESKLTANAAERLDKITRLSGRSPELGKSPLLLQRETRQGI